jgi:hypothetical protein
MADTGNCTDTLLDPFFLVPTLPYVWLMICGLCQFPWIWAATTLAWPIYECCHIFAGSVLLFDFWHKSDTTFGPCLVIPVVCGCTGSIFDSLSTLGCSMAPLICAPVLPYCLCWFLLFMLSGLFCCLSLAVLNSCWNNVGSFGWWAYWTKLINMGQVISSVKWETIKVRP